MPVSTPPLGASCRHRLGRRYGRVSQPDGPGWGIAHANGGRFSPIGGGVHILEDGVVVGGIGISGGTAHEDHDVAMAAVARLTEQVPSLTTKEPS